MSDASVVSSPGPHGELAVRIEAIVLDVGLAGVAIESETRLTPERRLTVRFGEADRELALPGRVVWCFFHGTTPAASGEQRPVYRAGIEFADLLTPSARRLVAYLEQQIVSGGENRLFGRFRLAPSQELRIESCADFRCLELAADSVQVEVDLAVEPVSGQQVTLSPRNRGTALPARIVSATRGELPKVWRLVLEWVDAEPAALASLRGVAFD